MRLYDQQAHIKNKLLFISEINKDPGILKHINFTHMKEMQKFITYSSKTKDTTIKRVLIKLIAII